MVPRLKTNHSNTKDAEVNTQVKIAERAKITIETERVVLVSRQRNADVYAGGEIDVREIADLNDIVPVRPWHRRMFGIRLDSILRKLFGRE
jgi:hypothetical protein